MNFSQGQALFEKPWAGGRLSDGCRRVAAEIVGLFGYSVDVSV